MLGGVITESAAFRDLEALTNMDIGRGTEKPLMGLDTGSWNENSSLACLNRSR